MTTPPPFVRALHSHINRTSVPWVARGGRCSHLRAVTGVTVEMSPRSQRGHTQTRRDRKRFREMRRGWRERWKTYRTGPTRVAWNRGEDGRGWGRGAGVSRWDYGARGERREGVRQFPGREERKGRTGLGLM